jgi:transcriptional regulator with XRE-family HTH domain
MGGTIIAKRLRQARLHAGLSQQTLGTRAGIDELSANSRISQYERGIHLPDLLTAQRLAKVLGVPAPFLYAVDDALAYWILAFGKVSASVRRDIVRQGAFDAR